MIYEGPESLRGILTVLWEHMRPHTTRPREPLTLVGGIEVMTSTGKEICIAGDSEKNAKIDDTWETRIKGRRDIIKGFQALFREAKKGNITELATEIPGVGMYRPELDTVFISSYAASFYAFGDMFRVFSQSRGYTKAIDEMNRNFKPQFMTIALLSEFGDTAYNRELQHQLAGKRPRFRRDKQPYDLQSLPLEGIDITQAREKQGIAALELAVAVIAANKMMGEEEMLDEKHRGARTLQEKAAKMSVREFLEYGKRTAEEAYARPTHVGQLILSNT